MPGGLIIASYQQADVQLKLRTKPEDNCSQLCKYNVCLVSCKCCAKPVLQKFCDDAFFSLSVQYLMSSILAIV